MAQDPVAAFTTRRPRLFSIAYRMLGSVADAEDIIQDTFLRWQQATRETAIDNADAYLTSIVTRLCLNQLKSARVRREAYIGPWLPEPLVADAKGGPDPAELADSLSIAFLVLLEGLSPIERAVFLLRVVFEYSYAETAAFVGKSEANCRQLVHRARQRISARQSRFVVSEETHKRVLQRFIHACTDGDLESLKHTLSEDITFYADSGGKTTAPRQPIQGRAKVARFILGALRKLVPPDRHTILATINGQPGVISYVENRPASVLTFAMEKDHIEAIYLITNPEKMHGLPPPPA